MTTTRITDYFDTDPMGTRWAAMIIGGESYASGQWTLSGYAYHTTPVQSLDQWARVKLATIGGSDRGELQFRVPGSGDNLCYGINFGWGGPTCYAMANDNNGWHADLQQDTFPSSVGSGDVIAATITGTGTSTRIRCWLNPTNLAPYDVENWDSANDPPDLTYSAEGEWSHYCDTGLYVGLGAQQATNVFDEFVAGDFEGLGLSQSAFRWRNDDGAV